jgi:hypothetical protein
MANGKLAPGIAACALLALVWAGHAAAETSSWVGRGDGPAEPVPKKKEKDKAQPKQAPVKIIKTVPSASPALPAVAPPIMPSFKGVPAGHVEPARPPVVAVPKPPASAPPDASDAMRGTAAPAPINASEYAKTLPPSEDAAYEAFDQGRYLTALQLAAAAAARGDPQAHTLVGRIYAEGLGAPKNPGLAAQWYARGAELGDVEAMFALGIMLAEGQGVVKDREAAGQMLEAAALRKHPLANYNLALLFLRGDGKPENPHRALAHMLFAAEAGVAAAQYDLGTLYGTGTGAEPNAFEAAKWTGKAAVAGLPEAQLEYGVMLFQGRGVQPDPKRGAELFRAAAERGLPVAQNRLARCYLHGAGVEMNVVEAAKWHLIASAGGVADEALDKVVAKLSRADRARAQKAAEDWRERQQMGIE